MVLETLETSQGLNLFKHVISTQQFYREKKQNYIEFFTFAHSYSTAQ